MEAKRVVVAIADESLARVLVRWLRDTLGGQDVEPGPTTAAHPGDVLLATPADLSAEEAAELATAGTRPIILTPIPRGEEAARFANAGAAYIVMSIDDSKTLELAVRAALGVQCPATASLAAVSQRVSPRSA